MAGGRGKFSTTTRTGGEKRLGGKLLGFLPLISQIFPRTEKKKKEKRSDPLEGKLNTK